MAVKCRACWDSGFVFGEACMAPNCEANVPQFYRGGVVSKEVFEKLKIHDPELSKIAADAHRDSERQRGFLDPALRKLEKKAPKRLLKEARTKCVGAIGTGGSRRIEIVVPEDVTVPHSKRLELMHGHKSQHTLIMRDPDVAQLEEAAGYLMFYRFAVVDLCGLKDKAARNWLRRRALTHADVIDWRI